MEGAPKNTTETLNFEKGADSVWRMQQEQAPEQAKELVAQIDGYEAMSVTERVQALQSLMEDLATDNSNRFVVEELARTARAEEAIAAYENTMATLGESVGTRVDARA